MPNIRQIRVGLLSENCYLLWQDGRDDCVLIDPGAQADVIRAAAGDKRIAAILLTHGHFDHIGAVKDLMSRDTELVIHPKDAPMLSDTALNASWMISADITAPAPTRMAREGDVLSFAGMEFTVFHTPGHTPGGVCYLCESTLFTGDTVMGMGYGRTDLPGGSDEEMDASLERILPLRSKYRFLGGHG